MQIVDMETSGRKKHFDWFNRFDDPTYSIDVRIDVTNIKEHAKRHGKSFFIEMLYLVTEALHSVPEMRMRIKGEEVVLFEEINPAYTIMTESGVFENCKHKMSHEYETFYARAAEAIAVTKKGLPIKTEFNDVSIVDDFYLTSLPWVDVISMTHPIPTFDKENLSIPRIGWGKYVERDESYELGLNLTANHALVDGKHLADVAVNLQKMIDEIEVNNKKLVGWQYRALD